MHAASSGNSLDSHSPDSAHPMKRRQGRNIQILLLLLTAEGVLSLLLSFFTRSMDRRAIFLGYSLSRILINLLFLLVLGFLAAVTVWTFVKPQVYRQYIARFDSILTGKLNCFLSTLLALLWLILLWGYFLFLYHFSYITSLAYPIQVAIQRYFIALIWLASIPLQIFIELILDHVQEIKRIWYHRKTGTEFLVFFIGIVASLHWMTLILHADWIYKIPGWFWYYTQPKLPKLSWIFFILTAVLIYIFVWILQSQPDRKFINLILSIGFAYLLQICFGFALGQGYTSIYLKFSSSNSSYYLSAVCSFHPGWVTMVREYEKLFSHSYWLGTKPPGLYVVYLLFRGLVLKTDPAVGSAPSLCTANLEHLASYLVPLVSALVLIPLSGIERLVAAEGSENRSGLLLILTPSVLLMFFPPDQCLYLFYLPPRFFLSALPSRQAPRVLESWQAFQCTL
jgi:hypothetical protein